MFVALCRICCGCRSCRSCIECSNRDFFSEAVDKPLSTGGMLPL